MRDAGLALAALCALSLSGCIDSSRPILADAEPVFGERLKLQYYNLRKGLAHEPQQGTYRWNGNLYAHAAGGMREVGAFSAHPFEGGTYIIQMVPAKRAAITEYALMRRLADGVFLVNAIDQDDADGPTRAAYCKQADKSACRIETREQLFAFARATAARAKDDGGLVVRLPDGSDRPDRRRR
jgi:hypothetical protein